MEITSFQVESLKYYVKLKIFNSFTASIHVLITMLAANAFRIKHGSINFFSI